MENLPFFWFKRLNFFSFGFVFLSMEEGEKKLKKVDLDKKNKQQ